MEDVMRIIYTLICISFIGFAVHAQPPRDVAPFTDSMMQSLTSGDNSSLDSIMNDALGSAVSAGQPLATIEGPLIIDVPAPEVTQPAVEAIDTRTGRYLPRLRINFTEFPLRTFVPAERPTNGHSTKTAVNVIAQRIQDRLRVPKIDLVVKDRTAIVSGTVTTERQRALVESMLRFEPGIDAVQNKITLNP
jgi:hypothetical protein